VLAATIRLAEMKVLLRVTGMGEGPVHERVATFSKRIFASHAEQDRPIVAATDALLSSLGIAELRWGEKVVRAGDNYLQVVQSEITQSDAFQLFWSQHAEDLPEGS
ncbi:MAG TPA: hypothetical protein VGQ28_17550, partial [Thermoanaerobaculia bacterium]|nr:hypothetical protein [Thermoanaerobaculia bacterium]